MFSKRVTNIIAFIALVVLLSPMAVLAANPDPFGLDSSATTLGINTNTYEGSLQAKVVGIVMWAMGFIGLIAIVVMLIGGVTWMTAGGNDEKVKKGRMWIINGAIGLVIALLAYGIAIFVESTTVDLLADPDAAGYNF
ncbi:MAG: hypothetical protein AUJ28_01955 [Parcubacteria group bacterium CG1_02_37_51]|uniref:Uncharacterized protein n=2 Tax=Candidatus Komeiliibacteriota TaxID=1817908 RepID=A0A2M8DRK8_9BACT|nr:MAG: hypothetical protein AUJ28_01955 [Parcubacteria group bacterium CG1_02_37_51]PIY94203.1 MAG: hypothetical protein COY67_02990 [Candidatus Komeilibacteria bacterium CG_4_10_14_0_8_um_filter_37_78]PJC02001.1 MAG: hypothetical protein CO073_01740 [Candidatus Komeilibacteria bacterium CG_4_9_14_0_8_um_filter_36_9]